MSEVVKANSTLSYANLVEANILRYRAGDGEQVEVSGVLPKPEGYDALKKESEKFGWRLIFTLGLIISLSGFLATLDTGGAVKELIFWLIPLIGFSGAILKDNRLIYDREKAVFTAEASSIARVPGPVGEACARIVSACHEIEDGNHPSEVVASSRLAKENAVEMIALVHQHNLDGTLHTAPAQQLMGEMYRLAAEMDAYLVLHRMEAMEIAPGEDDAVLILSKTSELSFGDPSTRQL